MNASLSNKDEPEKKATTKSKNVKSSDTTENLLGYVHTFLFATFFAISYFVANKDTLRPTLESFGIILAFNLVIALGLSLFTMVLIKSRYVSAFAATLLTILILNVGRLFDFVRGTDIVIRYGIRVVGIVIFIVLLVSTIALVLVVLRKRQSTRKALAKGLAVIATTMVITSTVQLLATGFGSSNRVTSNSLDVSITPDNLPDIYYIVLDGYTRADVLGYLYEFDNSQFLNGLEEKGFYVADESFSNYTHSVLSISSTLDRRYINDFADTYGRDTSDYKAAFDLLKNNRTINELRSIGYNYVNLSTWNFTDDSDSDDVPFDLVERSKLIVGPISLELDAVQLVYLKGTVLNPFVNVSASGDEAEKILNTIQAASNLDSIDNPKFVFLHITSPHPPHFFKADGSINEDALKIEPYYQWIDREGYVEQTEYINKEITKLIENILARVGSKSPPIIVLASDHGGLVINNLNELYEEPISGIVERHSNLSAFYFPDKDYSDLYPGITPVNYFRIIFNKFLDQNEEILEDKIYYSAEKKYRFEDVTEAVKSYDITDLINWRDYEKGSSSNN